MADINLKTLTPDTSLPTDGFLFGADSQSAANPSVFTTQAVATTLLGSTALSGATVTTSQPVLNLSQTWNAGAVSFTGLRFNATDTASAGSSLLLDIQVGGASKAYIRKDGYCFFAGGIQSGGIQLAANNVYFQNDASLAIFGASQDLILRRAAAATLQLGAADAAAPVAQTLQVQSVVAGTSNTAGANFTINGSKGTGTGAGGSIIFQTAAAGITGTAQNAYAVALTIDGTGAATFSQGSLVVQAGTNTNIIQLGAGYAVSVANNGLFRWSSTSLASGTADLILARDAANTLALRNGTTAQTFNVYSTYTDASNYARLTIRTSIGGSTQIWCNAAGTGSAEALQFLAGAHTFSSSGGTQWWTINGSGHFLAATDNTYDIGAAAANRPRNVYAASGIDVGNGAAQLNATLVLSNYVQANVDFATTSKSRIRSSTNGNWTLFNSGATDFSLLQFGGTTSSFPALKRSSASLICRLADDSANAAFEALSLKTGAPTGGTSGTWKLGVRVAATTTLDTTQYIEVDVGGTLYKLAVVTS